MIDFGQRWLQSGQYAVIEGLRLIPKENHLLQHTPLVVSRGQAEAYFLLDDRKQPFILKKFLPGRNPDGNYIKAIQALIPQVRGFESGCHRQILNNKSVSNSGYYSPEFAAWLEYTILMPKTRGCDWAFLADQLRDGTVALIEEQRLSMCKSLCENVRLLENNDLAHRDLSATNIFIDTQSWEVHFIDWDSLYHSSLQMPANTTYGTNGYIAPFVKCAWGEDVRVTWQFRADRFAMAVLNMEFLSIGLDSLLTGDGGMFEQEEIYACGGQGMSAILSNAKPAYPKAVQLFERALKATSLESCPSPDEWLLCSEINSTFKAPSLQELYNPKEDFEEFLQKLQSPRPPQPKAPPLSEVESFDWKGAANLISPKAAPKAPKLTDIEDPQKGLSQWLSKKK